MSTSQRRSNLLVPALVALLFFGPFVAATLLYFYGGDIFRPTGSTAHGILIPEPRTLPSGRFGVPGGRTAAFGGKWSLLYVAQGNCEAACMEGLYRTRQVRRALGKEDHRVQRFVIFTGDQRDASLLAGEHPDLVVISDGTAARDQMLATLGEFADGDVFLADPLGNVMMRFPAGTSMKDMHKDLTLLLKASQIG